MNSWIPGSNPLTYERPFQKRKASPLEAAVYSSLLGPAVLMPANFRLWALLLVMLFASTLLLGLLGGRHRHQSRSGVRNMMVMLLLQPAALHFLFPIVGIDSTQESLLWVSSLFLICHTSALLFFNGRTFLAPEEAASWVVRASCLYPPVILLACLPSFAIPFLPKSLFWDPHMISTFFPLLWVLVLIVGFQLFIRRSALRRQGRSPGESA
jgi:hypothetical protein